MRNAIQNDGKKTEKLLKFVEPGDFNEYIAAYGLGTKACEALEQLRLVQEPVRQIQMQVLPPLKDVGYEDNNSLSGEDSQQLLIE